MSLETIYIVITFSLWIKDTAPSLILTITQDFLYFCYIKAIQLHENIFVIRYNEFNLILCCGLQSLISVTEDALNTEIKVS